MRTLAAVEKSTVKEWAKARGYRRYLAYSIKGEAAIDWSDKRARTALLAKIVADADRLLELSRQAQGELREDTAARQLIVAASELLGQLLLQDVERAEGGVSLKDGVSRERMMSVHDPEMRHGHKSSSRRFDGHKAAIVVDTGSQLITAVEVLPGNSPDNLGALDLVEASEANTGVPVDEAMCDAAYGDGDTRLAFADAGCTLIAMEYCADRGIEFTRSRAYRKNDQAWIEQKNGSVVRRFAGHDRYSGQIAGQTMIHLYKAVRLHVNYFQPSFKLPEKIRDGARAIKRYTRQPRLATGSCRAIRLPLRRRRS